MLATFYELLSMVGIPGLNHGHRVHEGVLARVEVRILWKHILL